MDVVENDFACKEAEREIFCDGREAGQLRCDRKEAPLEIGKVAWNKQEKDRLDIVEKCQANTTPNFGP